MSMEDQTVHTAELVAEGLRLSEYATRDTLTILSITFADERQKVENSLLNTWKKAICQWAKLTPSPTMVYGIQQWYYNEPTNETSNEI